MNINEKEAKLREGLLKDEKQLSLSLSMWNRWAKDPIVYGITAKTAKNVINHLRNALVESSKKVRASFLREVEAEWEIVNG